MNFKEYQELASRTANGFEDAALTNYALGLTGEAGEVADIIKKHVFHGHELNKEEVEKELGDVLWYLSQIAKWCDVDLEEIAMLNIEKLKKRYPDGFLKEASINRTE